MMMMATRQTNKETMTNPKIKMEETWANSNSKARQNRERTRRWSLTTLLKWRGHYNFNKTVATIKVKCQACSIV